MLTVLNVAYPLAPVEIDAVGGAEQILAAIDEALSAAGHRSIVMACAGSHVSGELIEIPAAPHQLTPAAWIAAHDACRAAMRDVLAREHIDVVHMHGIDFHAYLPAPGPPVLATLHLPLDWYPYEALHPTRPNTFLHCVSRSQRIQRQSGAAFCHDIENGVDLDRFRPAARPGDYALVLGRVCPEKGQHIALEAASDAGIPLVIAGKVFGFPEHEAYFRDQILPRLRPPHRFLGHVMGSQKAELIANARCVVVPSIVDETSSLVAMEAFACGTPVVGFRRGALIDLVAHGQTGLLADDVAQLAEAISNAHRLERGQCRAVAEARCARSWMVERYMHCYQQLVVSRARGARGLRVEIIDRQGLSAVQGAWAELWERTHDATAFQRPEWCVPWCEHLLRGSVEAVTVWKGSCLEALLPLFRWRDEGHEVLSLLGAGVSDYQDILLASGDGAVVRAVEDTLVMLAWDRLELSELRDGSRLLSMELAGQQEISEQEPCPALALGAHASLDMLPRKVRHDIEYQRRRAARELGIEHAMLSADELVDALTVLHRARWTARGEHGAIDDARRAFLHAACRKLAERDQLLGVGVRFGQELAAVAMTICDRDSTRYYLGGFAPSFEHRSPGMLAIAAAIEESCRRGAQWFDFLRGAEPYKYRLGAVDRFRLRRRVIRR